MMIVLVLLAVMIVLPPWWMSSCCCDHCEECCCCWLWCAVVNDGGRVALNPRNLSDVFHRNTCFNSFFSLNIAVVIKHKHFFSF